MTALEVDRVVNGGGISISGRQVRVGRPLPALRGGRDAHTVWDATQQAITTLPTELARTITWD
jgi:hypothetical protein